jgi:hypothetical protein
MRNSLDNYEKHRNQKDGEGGAEDHPGYRDGSYKTACLSAGAECVP